MSGCERAFSKAQVLCSTSTLALGVNLPAHLVVIKSTRRWSAEDTEVAGYKEYDTATCLQMIGRCCTEGLQCRAGDSRHSALCGGLRSDTWYRAIVARATPHGIGGLSEHLAPVLQGRSSAVRYRGSGGHHD